MSQIAAAAKDSVKVCIEAVGLLLQRILEASAGSGVPLGLNIESVSGYAEECEAAYTLFAALQVPLLLITYNSKFFIYGNDTLTYT